MPSINKWIIVAGLLAVPFCVSGDIANMAPIDKTIPAALYIADHGLNPAINFIFPGLSTDSSGDHLSVGYLHHDSPDNSYLWQPRSLYDQDAGNGHLSPYLLGKASKRDISLGLYLGNIVSDFAGHNRFSVLDTVDNFNKSEISMEGATWVALRAGLLRGVSFRSKGNYTNRNVHFQNSGEWKDLHTVYNYKKKYGYGLLSGLFSISDEHFICAGVEYGENIVSAIENQLDTLFFSTSSYISSSQTIDSSHTSTVAGSYLDYVCTPVSGNWIYGARFGANRSAMEYLRSTGDSTQTVAKGFLQVKTGIHPVSIFTGASISFSTVFFNRNSIKLGYLACAEEYTWDRSSHSINLDIPFLSLIKINAHFEILGGAQLHYSYVNSNFNFYNNLTSNSLKSTYSIELLPIAVRFNSNKRFIFSVTPSLTNNFVLSSLEVVYQF